MTEYIVECPRCLGLGTHNEPGFCGPHGGLPPQVDCSVCGGSGRVWATITGPASQGSMVGTYKLKIINDGGGGFAGGMPGQYVRGENY